MTLDKLIETLERMRADAGGHCQVVVCDGDDEWGFAVRRVPITSPESETGVDNVIVLDLTADPE
jgi:hypothetical protein